MLAYEDVVQGIVEAIEARLGEGLSLTRLAELAGFSDYHFHRMFQAIAGEPVMEYVRKRRLACAAHQIAYTRKRLLDISLDCGFGTQESFIRAFRKLYGMTPGEYRKRGIKPPDYPILKVPERRYNPYLGGIRMNYRMETKPAFYVIGYTVRTTNSNGQNNRDIPAFWQRYLQEKLGRNLESAALSNAEFGICESIDLETDEFNYVIGVEAKEGAVVPEGAVRRSYPEQTYAVFTTPRVKLEQFTESIQSTWCAIFSEWFPHSGYEHAGGIDFEYYDERCWSDRNELVEMDIYIPVKKKGNG